jgi:hypothetical protein
MAGGAVCLAIALSAPVEVRIEPPRGDGRWRAAYRFSEPVSDLDFQRGGGFRRAPGWRVETPGFVLGGGERRETIRLQPGGKPRREITLAFPVDTSHPEKDYQLFEPFSDGSLLLYTGHLNVVPAGSPEDAPAPPHRFVLRARKGEHLVVKGRLHRKSATFRDADGEGTFVYFGRLAPLETEDMSAVLDPALPAWMSRALRDGIPRLFADYTRLTGFALESRPSVLVSYRIAADPRSTSWKGGTLPGIIQMQLEAAADAPEDRALMRRFCRFLAHEAAHLWNGQLFQSVGKNQSWMHEGGADAFAWRALRRAGLIDDTELEDGQAGDLDECLAHLGEDSLQAAEERKDFRAVYACGAALAWLTEAGTGRVDPSSDLHTFWAALFRAAEPKGRRYDEAMYLALLRERKVAPATVSFMDDFIHRKMPGRAERTRAAFQEAGITVKRASPAR